MRNILILISFVFCHILQAQNAEITFSKGFGSGISIESYFCSDNENLITYGNNEIKLWNYKTGIAYKSYVFKDSYTHAVNPEKMLFLYFENLKLVFFDLTTGKEKLRIPKDDGGKLTFSKDGEYFAILKGYSIEIYKTNNPTDVYRKIETKLYLQGVLYMFRDLIFDNTGRKLITLGDGQRGDICIWDIETSKLVHSTPLVNKPKTNISATVGFDVFEISNNNEFLSCVYAETEHIQGSERPIYRTYVSILNLNTQEFKKIFQYSQASLRVRFVNDNKSVVVLGINAINNENSIKTDDVFSSYDLITSEKNDCDSKKYSKYSNIAIDFQFDPSGKYIVTDNLSFLTWPALSFSKSLSGVDLFESYPFFDLNKNYLCYGSNTNIGKPTFSINLQTSKYASTSINPVEVMSNRYSNSNKWFLNSNWHNTTKGLGGLINDGIIEIINTSNGQKIAELKGDKESCEKYQFSSDNKFIAAYAGKEDAIIVWDAKTFKKKAKFKVNSKKDLNGIEVGGIYLLTFSNDNKLIISGTFLNWSKLDIWDIEKGELFKTISYNSEKNSFSDVVFNTTGDTFASTNHETNGNIDLWNFKSGTLIKSIKNLKTETPKLLGFINNDKFIVSLSNNTTNIWNVQSGKPELSISVLKDSTQWIASTPDGRFDGTPDALKNFFVVKGLDIFPLDNLYEQCYTPNLIGRILSGEEFPTLNIQLNQLSKLPLVKILSPDANTTVSIPTASITVEATDQGGGIDEIRLYHNGKLIDGTQRGFKALSTSGTNETITFTIQLVNGENKIRATAFNFQRTEATPDEITINYDGANASSNMYILAVGIDSYTNSRYSLNYAVNDASGFVNTLKAGASSIFSNVNTTVINDARATRAGILDAVEQIKAKIKPEDVFVFYYAGHGVMSSGSATDKPDFYLVPTDVTKMYEADEVLKAKGISAKEIGEFSKNIKAQKQLFVLDACQSGGAMQSLASRGAAEEKAISQLARSTGTYFIAASGTEQFASEVQELGHGVFTYSLIEAIKGACKSQDGKITVNLLKSYVEDRVPELTKKYKGEAQYPTGYGFGQDFPIVIVK